MNGAVLLALSCVLFYLAYQVYGRLVERVFGVDPARPTPAHTLRDGVDYVPTHPAILFGHHFASIAGAGPIVGPVLAAQFGWAAVALWIVLGCILIGSVHDLAAMFLSIRHQGRSIGTVIESLMGYWGRMLFLFFCWFTLVLVVAEFLRIVAETFVEIPAVATASLLFIGVAVAFGRLVYKGGLSILAGSFIFVPLTFACVYAGTLLPLDLVTLLGCDVATARQIWTVVLLAYCFAASVLPVWLLLQPRDYLNSYLLYAMMALGFIGIFVARPVLNLDAFSGWHAVSPLSGRSDPLIPLLFVTVACGACSGFHALVASGTTAKQVDSERHLRPVAYGGMLIEGALAIIALIAVGVMSQAEYAAALKTQGAVKLFAGGIAGFTDKLGLPHSAGIVFISLALAAFLMTTLDTATRLARFTWQELFLPREQPEDAPPAAAPAPSAFRAAISNRYVATLVAVAAAGWLLLGGGAKSLWPVFASSNQLLAALTLLGCSLWLLRHKRPLALTLLPMLFMMATSGAAIATLFLRNLRVWQSDGFRAGGVMTLTTGILIIMSVALVAMGAVSIRQTVKQPVKGH
ncbi:MAG: carbon starvation protein A [Kiritimatiellia bacterium]|jgi:carbon starvation protein|nr:carbon starvation protein A [Kiritimatiellia bacterium]MDD4173186.1 carbon starvation protein A [Kiritimatiellia bacterium]MDD4440547.1 carbon starvation protein A [Kiritimatiellia bacterium]NLC82304.1 carbon starvation protein A [Lentisphaerota bacterium]